MSKTNGAVHDGHRNRVREKFRKSGFAGMHPHEILEMLLFYSIPRKDTNEIAHALIEHFGSLSAVFEASEEELVKIDGVSQNSAVLIRMMLPLFAEYSKDLSNAITLRTSEQCGEYFKRRYYGKQNESVCMVCIDGNCRVIYVEEICEGDATNVIINVRKIIETVLKFPKASAVILAHNHPHSIALPSRDDISATIELRKILGTMGINLIDHIIVADNDYVSMARSDHFANVFK